MFRYVCTLYIQNVQQYRARQMVHTSYSRTYADGTYDQIYADVHTPYGQTYADGTYTIWSDIYRCYIHHTTRQQMVHTPYDQIYANGT
uniref:Uncharacterized protein n=1 Tax=Arion vulgaris TaxID=1028688 RepID=A0A0B6ZU45_9EUPU